MKIGEYIELIRSLEHDRLMLVKERGSILATRFEDVVKIGTNASTEQMLSAHDEFLSSSVDQITKLNKKIDDLTEQIVEGRSRINKQNNELGISEKLTQVKHLRMELSTLDKIVNGDRYDRLNTEMIRMADIRGRLVALERAKRSIENEIRVSNYSNDI